MGQLHLITSNPVTDEFNAAEKRAADQATADLQNAVTQQNYDFNTAANPTRLKDITTLAGLHQTQADTEAKKAPWDVQNAETTAEQGQEDYRHSKVANPLLEQGDQADLSTKQSQNRVQIGTEGDQETEAKNRAIGTGLSNKLTQSNIDNNNTSQRNTEEDRQRKSISEDPELHEDLTIQAATDPEGAIQRGKAAGVITTPQQEALLRNSAVVGQSNVIISMLRSVAPSDANWRNGEFNQILAAAQADPTLLQPQNRAALRQRVLDDLSGGADKHKTDARAAAAKLLTDNPQFQMAKPDEQEAMMDHWTDYFYRGGQHPPADGSDQSAAGGSTSTSGPGLGTRIWNYAFGGGSSAPAGSKPAAQAIPKTPDGKVDRGQLRPNTVYDMPGVGSVTFDGKSFVATGE